MLLLIIVAINILYRKEKQMKISNAITLYVCIVVMTITNSLCAAERPSQQPESLTGWAYAQSWFLSEPQLLLYMFEHNLFEYDNNAHKELVDDALLISLKNMDLETLQKIFSIIEQKFPHDKHFIKTETNNKINDLLTTLKKGLVLHTQSELSLMQQNQLQQCSSAIHALQKEQDKIIAQLLAYKTEQEKQLALFRTHYKQCTELTDVLHTLAPRSDNDDALVKPPACDTTHMNQQVMSQENQYGKDNHFMQSLIVELHSLKQSTQKFLTLCEQGDK
jgi:hypothetical protein